MTFDNGKAGLQQELERRILHGLACEWENAVWLLPVRERKLMQQPLFSIRDMGSRLGSWSPGRREISLNRSFILDHPWDAVREVLLHEIAHQFSDELLGGTDESSHGPAFREACRTLRANPKASGNHKPLRHRLHEDVSEDDRVLVKVKKLMALAQSGNRHEAEAAMVKAYELISKYNLDLIEDARHRDFVSIFLGRPSLRHRREDYCLARLLQDFYYVYGLWVSAYVLEKGRMGRVLEITGTIENIKIADYVYGFINSFIQIKWTEYNINRKYGRSGETDFAVGIIEGFRSKLQTGKPEYKKLKKDSLAIAIKDPGLQEYVQYKYPHVRTFKSRVCAQDRQVLLDGIKTGKKLVIHKGITGNNSGEIKHLE